ncbi:MAG: methylated-DNA--[protein]-cysteine S-methyltransferase [Planctomycetaceae bacterium]|nr:methylated-DNA--[protein]-cysteine S-methyltransferase [Planctomycetaceae bacterium]
MQYTWIEKTPVGRILVAADEDGVKYVQFREDDSAAELIQEDWVRDDKALKSVVQQLQAYFAGKLSQFDVPLAPEGTAFQKKVWKALCKVKFGVTASYGDIAKSIGNPAACRAVGLANGRNPIAIIIPCHRIIGTNGKLVGYGGGLGRKKTLLSLEGIEISA